MTALPPNSLIIDVGGGIGSTSMKLAEGFPELKFVVQDREAVCALGVEAWKARCPELLEAGRAVFQGRSCILPLYHIQLFLTDTNYGNIDALNVDDNSTRLFRASAEDGR